MKKIALLLVIISLLGSIVGYLAWDRHDKNVAEEKHKAFNARFLK